MAKGFLRFILFMLVTAIICLLICIPFVSSGTIGEFITNSRGFTSFIGGSIGIAIIPTLIIILLYTSSLKDLGKIKRIYRTEVFSAMIILSALGKALFGNNVFKIISPIFAAMFVIGIMLCLYSFFFKKRNNKNNS